MPGYKLKSGLLVQGTLNERALRKLKFSKSAPVFICEGRPGLEAGKSNAATLLSMGIIPMVISDNMAGFLFAKGYVKQLIMACQYADEGGALGDTGALICAVLAQRHQVPVKLLPGKIKTRFLGDPKDILSFQGKPIAPAGTRGYVPLVEWIPGKYLK